MTQLGTDMPEFQWVKALPAYQPWQEDALCASPTIDPDIFFPGRGENDKARRAKAVCQRCPVSQQCLEYALQIPAEHDFGVLGATTQTERKRLRRELTNVG